MSNWHVRIRSGNTLGVVFHIPVPAGNNAGSPAQSWANAIKNSGLGGTTILPDGVGTGNDGGISTTEKTSIVAGTVWEVVGTYEIQAGQSAAQIATALTAQWTDLQTHMTDINDPSSLRSKLNFFGSVG